MQGHWGFLTWAVRKAILMRSSSPETRTRHSSSPGRDLWHNVKSYYLQWRRAALSSPSSDMINFESFSSIRELIYINSEFQPWLTNNIFFYVCACQITREEKHIVHRCDTVMFLVWCWWRKIIGHWNFPFMNELQAIWVNVSTLFFVCGIK